MAAVDLNILARYTCPSCASMAARGNPRPGIAKLVDTGRSLTPGVQRRLVIERIVSESVESAITGQTSVDAALAEAEHRINALLANLLDSNDWIDASSQAVSQHR